MVLKPGLSGIKRPTLGFYGFEPSRDVVERVYRLALGWFERFHCPPHQMVTSLDGHKYISFKRSAAKLEKSDFRNIGHFEIISLTPGGPKYQKGGNLNLEVDFKGTGVIALSARPLVAMLTPDSLLWLAREIATTVGPEYGIGCYRDEALHPTSFVHGYFGAYAGFFGSKEEQRRKREMFMVNSWGQNGGPAQVWREEILRDVYPWNFLNATQLKSRVDECNLEEWIRAGPGRGTLSEVASGLVSWEVPKKHIASVRNNLWNAGILFDPTYIVKARCQGGYLPSVVWRIRERGEPTLKNLEKWVQSVPANLGHVLQAEIIDHWKQNRVTGWTNPSLPPSPLGPTPHFQPSQVDVAKHLHHFRTHPPRCLASFTTQFTKLPRFHFDGHGEEMNAIFQLQCSCGHSKFAVLGEPGDDSEVPALTGPLALRCHRCKNTTLFFDPGMHGYNAELEPKPAGPTPPEDPASFACDRCGPKPMEVFARFEYPDDLFDDDFEQAHGRQQDFFTWFSAVAKCPGCKRFLLVYDQECA